MKYRQILFPTKEGTWHILEELHYKEGEGDNPTRTEVWKFSAAHFIPFGGT